jgi:hypothetical protein
MRLNWESEFAKDLQPAEPELQISIEAELKEAMERSE